MAATAALSRSKSFNVTNPESKLAAAFILGLCFCGWAIQLGGVASLQACCGDELDLGKNSMLGGLQGLFNVQPLMMAQAMQQGLNQSLLVATQNNLLDVMSFLSHRSSSVFTLTPDQKCSEYYRYQWLNVSAQIFVLALCGYAMASGFLQQARMAVCGFLTVATVIAIENAHSFFHVNQYAPDLSGQRGKVFFVGCVITSTANLMLLLLLGMHDESAGRRSLPVPPSSRYEPTVEVEQTQGQA